MGWPGVKSLWSLHRRVWLAATWGEASRVGTDSCRCQRYLGTGSVPAHWTSLLSWFEMHEFQVHVVTSPVSVDELTVSPQGELPWGTVDEEYLSWLVENQDKRLEGAASGQRRIWVSRSAQVARLAGETAVDRVMSRSGWSVLIPERLPLVEQLTAYASASELVFSEGSAIHALQLLGRVDSRVQVLCRRQGTRIAEVALRDRGADPTYLETGALVLSALHPDGYLVEAGGLSLASEDSVVASLRALDSDLVREWRSEEFSRSQASDLTTWFLKRTSALLGTAESHWDLELSAWAETINTTVPPTVRSVLLDVVDSCKACLQDGAVAKFVSTAFIGIGAQQEGWTANDYVALAEKCETEGLIDQAFTLVELAVQEADHRMHGLCIKRANCRSPLGICQQRCRRAQRAVAMDSAWWGSWTQLAYVRLLNGQLPEALEATDQALGRPFMQFWLLRGREGAAIEWRP